VREVQPILDSVLTRFTKRAPANREILLVQRRIFILPTRAGVVFGAILTLMLAGSINYGLSLGLVLTFLLGSFGITAMLHTFRNLAGLRVTAIRVDAVFAGETAQFAVGVHNPAQAFRYAIRLTGRAALASGPGLVTLRNRGKAGLFSETAFPLPAGPKLETDVVDVAAEGSSVLTVRIAAPKRGVLRPGRLTLHTRYPVGLYHAWSHLDLDAQCIVYPRPAAPGMPLPLATAQPVAGLRAALAADDFAGLRTYQPGDSSRHIAWKAAARGQALLTKQFQGAHSNAVWLSPDLVPERVDIEAKISRLTRWVLDAHAMGLPFGLRLPGVTVKVGRGERHRDRCLEALALHPSGGAETAAGSP
jgi:uncharacterized protein (DUF58 family)